MSFLRFRVGPVSPKVQQSVLAATAPVLHPAPTAILSCHRSGLVKPFKLKEIKCLAPEIQRLWQA